MFDEYAYPHICEVMAYDESKDSGVIFNRPEGASRWGMSQGVGADIAIP
jgi:hypothetical protein